MPAVRATSSEQFVQGGEVKYMAGRYALALLFFAVECVLLQVQWTWGSNTAAFNLALNSAQQGTTLIALAYGIWRYRPTPQLPWFLLLLGMAMPLLHQLIASIFPGSSGMHLLFGFSGTASLILFCVGVIRCRTLVRNPLLWLDVGIVCLGATIFVLYCLLIVWWKYIDFSQTSPFMVFWSPFVRLLLLAGILAIALSARRATLPLCLLLLGLLLMVLGDLLWLNFYGTRLHVSTTHRHTWQLLNWLTCALIGTGALLPDMSYLFEPGLNNYPAWGRLRVLVIFVAISLPMILLGSAPEPLFENPKSVLLLGFTVLMEAVLVVRCYLAIIGDQRARLEVLRRSEYDLQTGLPNTQSLHKLLAHDATSVSNYALAVLNIDGFSQINNIWGHDIGEKLLQSVAQLLQRQLDSRARLFRIGSYEFAVHMPLYEERSRSGMLASLRKLLGELGKPLQVAGQRFYLAANIGLSFNDQPQSRPIDTVLHEADVAWYRAKQRGGNTIVMFEAAMREEVAERQRLAAAMRQGLWHEFSLAYQPIVSLADDSVSAQQTLLRWTSAELGRIAPKVFLPLAEEAGLISEMTTWVMTQAFAELSRAPATLRLLVTITAYDLHDKAILGLLDWLQVEYRVKPHRVMLEMTESVMIEDSEDVLPLLRERGHLVVINHFGTGHSSLNSLTSLPVDMVKLAVPFIAQIEHNEHQRRLCKSMIALCHQSGLQVIAKGVETVRQRDLLREMDCDFAQGWLYGKPSETAPAS